MRIFEFIDYIQRRINSFLFRIVVLFYSIFILVITNGIINTYIYVLGLIIYFIVYILMLKHDKLRLLNDFLLIVFILIGKNPNDIVLFVFLILPAINSINFSGKRKSLLVYMYIAIIYMFLLCYYEHKYELHFVFSNLSPLISLIFLWLIDLYTSLRTKIRNFRERLNEVVDSFYLDKETIKKPHKIYNTLIQIINSNIKSNLIEDLLCFTIVKGEDEKVVIVNGSKFIWRYEFKDKDFIKKIRENIHLYNSLLYIDDKKVSSNISIIIKIEDFEYVFIFITKSNIPFYYLNIGLFRTLEPALSKLSKILLSEKRLQEVKNDELLQLSARSQYVNRANKTMHFIRNRLGPVANLIKMITISESIPADKIKEFKSLLNSERDRAKIELINITERANYLLEKSNNPFNFSVISNCSLQKLYSILKRNFLCYFPETEIVIVDIPDDFKRYVKINIEGFELFLSDWLNNIKKYKKDFVSTEFVVKKEELLIIFSNDFNGSILPINLMISDLMSNDRNEIMKRTTHGLYQIKSTLEDMLIPFDVYLNTEKNILIFKLCLKIIDHEDSNI